METWIPTKLATPDKDGEAGVDEAGDKDDEGWSQKEKREGKRSKDKREKKMRKTENNQRQEREKKLIK